jgi:hypothetical protein
MNKNIVQNLLTEEPLENFFKFYSNYRDILKSNPNDFFDFCLNTPIGFFIWVYLLNYYVYTYINKSIIKKRKIHTFNEFKDYYNPDMLTKDEWGNSFWFVIHTTALYGFGESLDTSDNQHIGNTLNKLVFHYKAMLSCLQYVLPCPKCRNHLHENLKLLDLNAYTTSRLKLFEFSVKLHNIVNKSLSKKELNIDEVLNIYIPK